MEKEFNISFPVFSDYIIKIIFTKDIPTSRDKRADILGALEKPMSKYVDGLHSYNDCHPNGIIFLSRKATQGTIAHECSHAIWRMFNWVGAQIENETFAYHLGYLVDELNKFKKSK